MKLSPRVIMLALAVLVAARALPVAGAIDAPEATTTPASSPAPAPSVSTEPSEELDGLGSPMLLAIITTFFAVMLILVGTGIVAAVVTLLAAAMLVGLGIISTSVAVGIVQRRARSGFRVFFLLCGAAGGVPAGIGTTMTVSWLFNLHFPWRWIIGGGAVCGAIAGLIVAAIFNFAWARIIDYLIRKVGQR